MTPGAPGHDLTRTNALVGSPFYMSPEQMQSSKGVDSRADIWSLGVILFELLACRPPFMSESVTELAIHVAMTPAPPLRAFRADAPPGLEHVIARCLEKEPGLRYQTVGELAIALKDFGSKQARSSVERVLGTLRQAGISGAALPPSGEFQAATARPSAHVAPNTTASWGQTSPGQGQLRSRSAGKALVAVAAAVIMLTVCVTGGTLLLRRRATTSTPPSHAAATASFIVPSTLPATTPSVPPAQTGALPAVPPAPSAVSTTPKPTAAPPPRPTLVAPSPAPALAAPSCDPNFTLDDQGRKHWKPECFLK
jgi:serine/threonine-protein kinase